MLFTPAGGSADRSIELVRQSLLQGEGDREANGASPNASSANAASEGVPPKEDDGGIVYT